MKNILSVIATLHITFAAIAQKNINVDSAASYVGQTVIIFSKICSTKALDPVTLLNVGPLTQKVL